MNRLTIVENQAIPWSLRSSKRFLNWPKKTRSILTFWSPGQEKGPMA